MYLLERSHYFCDSSLSIILKYLNVHNQFGKCTGSASIASCRNAFVEVLYSEHYPFVIHEMFYQLNFVKGVDFESKEIFSSLVLLAGKLCWGCGLSQQFRGRTGVVGLSFHTP